MPTNLELRKKISGSFNNADSLVYLKTTTTMVDGLLDGGGKINYSLLPSYVLGGMKFVTSYAATLTSKNLSELFSSYVDATKRDTAIGSYIVITTGDNGGTPIPSMVVTNNALVSTHTWSFQYLEDGIDITGNPTIEAGDWIIYKGYTGSNPYTFQFAVINNTYSEATTTAAGTMSAADKTKLNGLANYTHPAYTARSIDATDIETIDVVSVDATGHVSNFTKQTIRSATTAVTGVSRLATLEEAQGGSNTAAVLTPYGGKQLLDWFSGLKEYGLIATANTAASAAHVDGAFALFLVA
jgi:hypothetical protein